jgi:hypothetical protein
MSRIRILSLASMDDIGVDVDGSVMMFLVKEAGSKHFLKLSKCRSIVNP